MCELNDHTRGMFNKAVFDKMKNDSVFINVTRGGVVNQDDLYEALTNGCIAAAGLDVTTPEPLPPSHKLLTLPNCVVLPHIGSASIATRQRMADLAVDNIVAAALGQEMPNKV